MCQHRSESNVTNAFDVLHRGVELIVNDNAAPVVLLNTNGLKVQTLGIWTTADSDKDDISIELRKIR